MIESKISRNLRRVLMTLAPAACLALACGGDGESSDGPNGGCGSAKCDDPPPEDFACQSIQDLSENGFAPGFVEGFKDPVATFLLKRGDSCPKNLDQVFDKLREQDVENCDGGGRTGLATRIVTEVAQLTGEPAGMRAVTTRTCDNRPEFGLILSIFGIGPNSGSLPQNNNELIGFDPEAGVFNYYTLESGQWAFHGSSLDFIQGKGGRCKNCHTGGGLIMKELNAPWVHWEGDTTTPGAGDLVDRIENLGSKRDGINMEGMTKQGNVAWNSKRVEILSDPERTDVHGGSTAELLRPLFCSTEFNLQSVGGPAFGGGFPPFPGPGPGPLNALQGGSPASAIPLDLMVDTTLMSTFSFIQMDNNVYKETAASVGQTVSGIPGSTDTFFEWTFIERAHADNDYVQQLTAAGIVDDQFIKDVGVIDFTRPVFSDDRCALLQFAPTFEELDMGGGGESGGGESGGGESGGGGETGGGAPDGGSCCDVQGSAGCGAMGNSDVESCVCDQDRFCCNNTWDQQCVNEVVSFGCGSCGGEQPPPAKGSCCVANGTPGCDDAGVESCTCAADSFCCDNQFDNICANIAKDQCNAQCGTNAQQAFEPQVSAAPQVSTAAPTVEAIRLAMLKKLQAANPQKGDPANELMVNLGATEQNHQNTVKSFLDACKDRAENRGQADFIRDLLTIAAHKRQVAKEFNESLEFAQTMVTDSLNPSSDVHLDPSTCELVQ